MIQRIYKYFRPTSSIILIDDDDTIMTNLSSSTMISTNSMKRDYCKNREEYVFDHLAYYFHEFSWRIDRIDSMKNTIIAISRRTAIIIDIDDDAFDSSQYMNTVLELCSYRRILLLRLNLNDKQGRYIESPWTFNETGITILSEKKKEFKERMDIVKSAIIRWIVYDTSEHIKIIELFY